MTRNLDQNKKKYLTILKMHFQTLSIPMQINTNLNTKAANY